MATSPKKRKKMFYVYTYRDPRPLKNNQVVYVGKGTERRAWYHWEKRASNKGLGHFLAILRQNNLEPIIEIVREFEDEADAFLEEIRLIEEYGRRDLKTGTLFNLTAGGEGFSNLIRTEEWCKNISDTLLTETHRSRQSIATQQCWANSEWREKTAASIRKALKDPEVIARRAAGLEAFKNSEEYAAWVENISTRSKANWANPEYVCNVVEALTIAQNTPEAIARKSKNSKALWEKKGDHLKKAIKTARNTKKSKAKTSAQAKQQWADPDYKAKQTANNREIAARPEVKAAKAAALKAKWADPEFRAKMMAARAKRSKT